MSKWANTTVSKEKSKERSKDRKKYHEIDSDQEFDIVSVDSLFKSKESSIEKTCSIADPIACRTEDPFLDFVASFSKMKNLNNLFDHFLSQNICKSL